MRHLIILSVLFLGAGCTPEVVKPQVEQVQAAAPQPVGIQWYKLGRCKYVAAVEFEGTDQRMVIPVSSGICTDSI